MAGVFENKDRKMIPNWRSFNKTVLMGELDMSLVKPIVVPNLSIDSYIEDFKEKKTVPHAADLISASIVNGCEQNESVKDAATFIIANKKHATKSQSDIADRIVGDVNKDIENKLSNITIKELDNCLPIDFYRNRIKLIKKYVIEYPYNPISWVELSRSYSILGQEKQAVSAMKSAVQLCSDNRFILRSAIRLFAHYGDIELAHDIVRKSTITNYDPWITSAEIAIASLRGRSSKFIKRGIELLNSNKFSPFSTTELASSIGTIELAAGSRKKSRELFNKSLIAPNDNSLAQMEWILNQKDKTLFDRSLIKMQNEHNFEAQALFNFHDKKLVDALNNTCQWFCDMPFSKRPVMLGTHIAEILGYTNLAVKFLETSLISHPNDPQLLNNIAYYLALENKTDEALKYYNKINYNSDISKLTEICTTATYGLICFRTQNIMKEEKHTFVQ